MTSRLTFHESNHSYWLADADSGKKKRVPSVTALKKMLYPFDNDDWKIRQAAEAVADNWDSIADQPPTSRVDAMRKAAKSRLEEAMEFGRAVHHYCEQLWTGQPIQVPDEYAGHVASVADWWEAYKPLPMYAEALCWSDADDLKGGPVAGRLDLIVTIGGLGVGLLDIKTWRSQASGSARPAEWAFQLAGYAGMDHIVEDGQDRDFPRIDWIGVLHVGPGGCRMWSARRWWEATQQVELARAMKTLPGAAMQEMTT